MTIKKYGKGLTSLLENIQDASITTAPSKTVEGLNVYEIEIENVFPNKDQPRKHFGLNELRDLEASIKVHGILQPLILVKKPNDKYMIVAGERRFRAAKSLGFKTVPAIVKDISEEMVREISLIENLQREDLNAIEEAEALHDLTKLNGYTQEQLAERIGKARSSVANTMRLLQLDKEVQNLVRQDRLSPGHARALIPVTNVEHQCDFAYDSADGGLTVRELERKVRVYLNPTLERKTKMSSSQKSRLTLEMKNFVDEMKQLFMTKVQIVGNESKGRITIDYFSRDDLDRIYAIIESLRSREE